MQVHWLLLVRTQRHLRAIVTKTVYEAQTILKETTSDTLTTVPPSIRERAVARGEAPLKQPIKINTIDMHCLLGLGMYKQNPASNGSMEAHVSSFSASIDN